MVNRSGGDGMTDSAQKIAKDVKVVVEGYLEALKGRTWGDWRAYTQLTFRDKTQHPALPQFTAYNVGKCHKVEGMSDCVRQVEVSLRLYPDAGRPMRWINGRLQLIREDKPYHPSEDGEWGVCPVSWRPEK
jgi:hypothetical protein